MHAKGLIAVLAAGVSAVAAQYVSSDGTTTSTMTQTQTITITRCNPTATNCPAHSTSSSAWYPTYNSTSVYWPTSNVTTYATPSLPPSLPPSPPSSLPPTTSTNVVPTTPYSAPPTVSTSGARNLLAQRGLLLSVVVAGAAMLA